MAAAVAATAERAAEPQGRTAIFTFNSDNQARGHFVRDYEVIYLGGGVNSGKSTLHGLDIMHRGRPKDDGRGGAETDQLGAILVNTLTTFRGGLYNEIAKIFKLTGRDIPVYDRQPPRAWQIGWAHNGVEIPAIPSYRGILTSPDGVHVQIGTLHNQSVQQYETLQFGWARIEEAINNELTANETVRERVRCMTGGASNPDCARYHSHTCYWIFNPPRGAHKYLYRKLDEVEEAAKKYYHALREGETCDGCFYVDDDPDVEPVARTHGPVLDHRGWPLLQQGVGKAILIRSKTSDNAANQNRGYRSGLASNMTKDTAKRRLDGEIIRETAGRAYYEWTGANIRPVKYDPDRTVYMGLDFNIEPRAAVFAHPLNPGEYPSEHHRPGLVQLGVFGEYFFAGEMDDRTFARELVKGGRGDGFDLQPKYHSEMWRGLPPPCTDECVQPCREGHWNGLKAHRALIVGYGDQRGTHRSSSADNLGSSWDIVDLVFQKLANYARNVPEDQPPPRSRVDAVNAKLCNELDVRTLWIDPRCEETIRDFEQVMWDDDGQSLREWRRDSTGTEKFRTHLTDGLGYLIHRLCGNGEKETGMDAVATTMERTFEKKTRTQFPMRSTRRR